MSIKAKPAQLPVLLLSAAALLPQFSSAQTSHNTKSSSPGAENPAAGVAEKLRTAENLSFNRSPYRINQPVITKILMPAIQHHMPLASSIKANRKHRDDLVKKDMELIEALSDRIDERAIATGKLAPKIKNKESTVKKLLLLLAVAKELGVHPKNFDRMLEMCLERTGPYLQFAQKSGNYLHILPEEMEKKLRFIESQLESTNTKDAEVQANLYLFLHEKYPMTAEQIFPESLNLFLKKDWEIEPEDALRAIKTVALFKLCYQDNEHTGFFIAPGTPFPALEELSEYLKDTNKPIAPSQSRAPKRPINS